MKQLKAFIKKEFFHVLRDRKTLLILFGMPVMQILIFGFALSNEIKQAGIVVMDRSHDQVSSAIIERISASRYFRIEKSIETNAEMEDYFKSGKIKMAIVFPENFEHGILHNKQAKLQIINDASDPNTASVLNNYVNNIISKELGKSGPEPSYRIIPEIRMMYNPQLKGAPNFVPGVMALVLMLVCVMMTAVSIVKEKETGTMEVLLVSPFNPLLVITSKAIPYLILSIINVCSILLLSVYVLDLPIQGSILLLLAESTLFITTCLSLGIFISIRTDSQQVAMLISLMGMLLPTILFSGFMFPIENMPIPLQVISNIVPAKWFYIIVKSIMVKGLGIQAVWKETLILGGMTILLCLISIKQFKIRLA